MNCQACFSTDHLPPIRWNSCLSRWHAVLFWAWWVLLAGQLARCQIATGGDIVLNELFYHPTFEQSDEEWLELYNRGNRTINLSGWRLSDGVQFEFPPYLLRPGEYVVVCANPKIFRQKFSETPALGPWRGSLRDRGELVRILDAESRIADEVKYASEGDWGQRWRVTEAGFPGWAWASLHDGLGNSLERIRPEVDGGIGQNWTSSKWKLGTPGGVNSETQLALAPFILKSQHHPAVPSPTDYVTITCQILATGTNNPSVTIFHRIDGSDSYQSAPMQDDGLHGDGAAGDTVFGAILLPQARGTIVEFYVQAQADTGTRVWPEPTHGSGGALANCLYQIDDAPQGLLPRYRLIVTAAERQVLKQLEDQPWYLPSNAQVNATFICMENGHSEVRYRCGLRQRGTTSRDVDPPSRRVNFPNDHPWRGVRAINLNGVRPHSQVVGSALARLAGLPAARARLVEVRENGIARSGSASPVAGLYAHNEELDEAYCDAAFPGDGDGNLYSTSSFADLQYLGDAATNYSVLYYYTKETNRGGNEDWSDLIGLTRAFAQTPDSEFRSTLSKLVNADEWAAYFACTFLIGNTESSLAYPSFRSGVWNTGDYFLYHGIRDSRFQLIPYDFDSVLGTEGGDVSGPYVAANIPAIGRFLGDPDFGGRFHAALSRLSTTVLSPESVSDVIDRLLAPHIPEVHREGMKAFIRGRPTRLHSVAPPTFRLTNAAPLVNGAVVVPSDSMRYTLGGIANPGSIRHLRVQNQDVAVRGIDGSWSVDLPLNPGMNWFSLEGVAPDGTRVVHQTHRVWRETPAGLNTGGTLTVDTVWHASQNPVIVWSDLVIPKGRRLQIDPGTTVSFTKGAKIVVQGLLLALGKPDQRIFMGVAPIYNATWGGIRFENTIEENQLNQVDLVQPAQSPLFLTNSAATFVGLTFQQANGNLLLAYYSSLLVHGCDFPDVTFGEPVGILGVLPKGQMRFEGNRFGKTVGYADVIEASLLKLPGPILEIIDNEFLGGGDDGLDLDGCDAYVAGNTFRHFKKDAFNQSTSISSAIAVGFYSPGLTSDIIAVRNIFIENDYDFEFKEGATLDVRHNTFLRGHHGSMAFSEPLRPGTALGKSARFVGCIWDGYATPMVHLNPDWITNGTIQVEVQHSILSQAGPFIGTNVLALDPRVVSAEGEGHLHHESPARRLVSPGLDAGALVPESPFLLNRPQPISDQRSYALSVVGAGITHYRFTLNDSELSATRSIQTPLVLNALPPGDYTLKLYGYGLNQRWQTLEGDSAQWKETTTYSAVTLNEILASNPSHVAFEGVFSDLIELYNPGGLPVDLGDMSLTDSPEMPRKFVFPQGTTIAPRGYLMLFADSRSQPTGLHTGFGLNADGEGLFLFHRSTQNNILLDSVRFGPQLAGKSIGRGPDSHWTLCQPTFGQPNEPAPTGSPNALRLNEFLAAAAPDTAGDFVELINSESLPVPLDGMALSESPSSPFQYRLPTLGYVEPGGYTVIRRDAEGEAIRLPQEFGSLSLVDPSGNVIDFVAYANQQLDQPEGRLPDRTGAFTPLSSGPTPGRPNAPEVNTQLSWTSEANPGERTLLISGAVAGQVYELQGKTTLDSLWQALERKTAKSDTIPFAVSFNSGIFLFRVQKIR